MNRSTVYTFVGAETGEPVHIAVDPLALLIRMAQVSPIKCEMGESLIDALKAKSLGVEPEHALTLTDAALEAPLIVCEYGDTHIIADGAHRLWRRWKRGDGSFLAFVVPESVWRDYTISLPGDGAFWDNFNRNARVR